MSQKKKRIRAIYEDGAFIPLEKLNLDNLSLYEIHFEQSQEDQNEKQDALTYELNLRSQKNFQATESLYKHLNELIKKLKIKGTLEDKLVWRVRIENEVRKIKRLGKDCPYFKDEICQNIEIRCGERQQFAIVEDTDQKNQIHKCNYKKVISINDLFILVVDDSPVILELCKDGLAGMGFDPDKIFTADSEETAEKIITEGKVNNRNFCIVISDIHLKQRNGYQLVNHIIERNFNSRILLMSGFEEHVQKPHNYLGDEEILQNEKVVSGFLKKPFHFRELTFHIKQIQKSLSKK